MKMTRSLTWMIISIFFLASGHGFSLTQFKDGEMHIISSTINDDVWVDYLAPDIGTVVDISTDGSIPSPYRIRGYNESNIILSGGHLSLIQVYDNGHLLITDGYVGTIQLSNFSQASILGGDMENVELFDNSRVTMSGGKIKSNGLSLVLYDSEWIIIGSDFAIDGFPVDYGTITSVLNSGWHNEPYRRISGILANGDLLDTQFKISCNAGSITLIPEPTTLSLLALGAFLAGRKRRAK